MSLMVLAAVELLDLWLVLIRRNLFLLLCFDIVVVVKVIGIGNSSGSNRLAFTLF